MSVNELVLKWYLPFTSSEMTEEEGIAFLSDCDYDEDKAAEVMYYISCKYYSN